MPNERLDNLLKLKVGDRDYDTIRVETTLDERFEESIEIVIPDRHEEIIYVLSNMLRENRLTRDEEFQLLGTLLYNVLFNNKIGEALDHVLYEGGDKTDEVRFLRIELEFAEKQRVLASWPWEYLCHPRTKRFLAQSTRLILTRNLHIPNMKERPLLIEKERLPIKVLFVSASPDGLDPVEFESVYEALKDLEKQLGKNIFTVSELITPYTKPGERAMENEKVQATWTNFLEKVNGDKIHIIHFVGHGQCIDKGGQIAFMHENGSPDWVDDSELAANLNTFDLPWLRLVFLQACESAQSNLYNPYQAFSGVANLLAYQNIPAVVAMQYKIKMGTANLFARTFYETLTKPEPIDVAVQRGRMQLQAQVRMRDHKYAFCLPVLYVRDARKTRQLLSSVIVASPSPAPDIGLSQASATSTSASVEIKSDSLQLSVIVCPWCGKPSNAEDYYCLICNGQNICTKCDTRVRVQRDTCGKCGAPIKPSARISGN